MKTKGKLQNPSNVSIEFHIVSSWKDPCATNNRPIRYLQIDLAGNQPEDAGVRAMCLMQNLCQAAHTGHSDDGIASLTLSSLNYAHSTTAAIQGSCKLSIRIP